MPSYTYWRIFVLNSGTNTTSVAELKFFDSLGSQIPTTAGTASASSVFSTFVAANAFDGSGSTFWDSSTTPNLTAPTWLQYQFPSAVAVNTFSIQARNDSSFTQTPLWFALQASNDGSTWTTIGNYTASSWTTAGQTQTFTAGTGLGNAYRLRITGINGTSTNVGIAELKFFDAGSTQIPTTGGWPLASSVFSGSFTADKAFDGNASTFWDSNGVPSSGSPQYLAYQFFSTVSPASFSITNRPDTSWSTQSPTAFSLETSNDSGNTWTSVQTYATSWAAAGQVNTFTIGAAVTVTFRRTRAQFGTRAGARQRTH